MSVARVKI